MKFSTISLRVVQLNENLLNSVVTEVTNSKSNDLFKIRSEKSVFKLISLILGISNNS